MFQLIKCGATPTLLFSLRSSEKFKQVVFINKGILRYSYRNQVVKFIQNAKNLKLFQRDKLADDFPVNPQIVQL